MTAPAPAVALPPAPFAPAAPLVPAPRPAPDPHRVGGARDGGPGAPDGPAVHDARPAVRRALRAADRPALAAGAVRGLVDRVDRALVGRVRAAALRAPDRPALAAGVTRGPVDRAPARRALAAREQGDALRAPDRPVLAAGVARAPVDRAPARRALTGRVRAAAPALLGAAVVGALVAAVGPAALVDGVAAVGPGPALAALGIGLLTTLSAAARWWLVARALDVPLAARAAVAETYRAQFLNAVLPAGVLGDVHRAVRHGVASGGPGARAVVLERATGQTVVVLTCLALLAVAPSLLGSGLAAVAAVAAAAALVLAALAAVPRLRVWLRAALGDLRTLLARGAAPAIVVLSVAGLAGHLTLFAVAARAVGVETGLVDLLPLLVVSLLAMVVPIGVGGWGPREATAVLAFGAAGHGAEQGLAVAVAFGVLSLVSCLPGVLVLRAPRC